MSNKCPRVLIMSAMLITHWFDIFLTAIETAWNVLVFWIRRAGKTFFYIFCFLLFEYLLIFCIFRFNLILFCWHPLQEQFCMARNSCGVMGKDKLISSSRSDLRFLNISFVSFKLLPTLYELNFETISSASSNLSSVWLVTLDVKKSTSEKASGFYFVVYLRKIFGLFESLLLFCLDDC